MQTLLSANASLEPPEGKTLHESNSTYILGDFNDPKYLIRTAVGTQPNLHFGSYFVSSPALWYKQNPAACKHRSVLTPYILLHPQFIVRAKSRACLGVLGRLRVLACLNLSRWRPACAFGSSSLQVCVLCFVGATFSVEGGHAKGQHGPALLRSPLFPPPLRNSPCTVRKGTLPHSRACTKHGMQSVPSSLPDLFFFFLLHPKISLLTERRRC